MYYNDEILMRTTSSGRMTSSVEVHIVRTMESGFPAATVRLHTHTYTLMTHCLNNTIHCASFKIAKARYLVIIIHHWFEVVCSVLFASPASAPTGLVFLQF